MPRGRSYATDNWRSFEKGVHSFVEDGFVHDKTLTFKARLENQNDGVDLKETIVEKTQGLLGAGQISFWLAANQRRTFFAKIGSTSNLNLQFDNGPRALKSISQNFYGGIDVNRSFTEKIGKVGLQLFKEGSWSLDSRLIYNFSRKNLSLDEKGHFSWNNWKFNGYTSLQLTNKLAFSQTGFLLTWSPSINRSWYFKFERKSADPTTIRGLAEGLALGWNAAVNETQTVGIEAKLNLNSRPFENFSRNLESVWLASEWKLDDTTVKAKINKQLSHAISVTNKLGTYGQYSLGVEMTEVGTKNRFKFGTQIDLNL